MKTRDTILTILRQKWLLIAMLFTIIHQQSNAQCCLTNSMAINTGYDPVTATTVTPGITGGTPAFDPHWLVTYLSADCQAYYPGVIPTYAAYVVPTGGWVAGTGCNWLSIANQDNYATDYAHTYEAVFSRPFSLCSSDNVTFTFDIAYDFNIASVVIDGGATNYFTSSGGCCYSFYSVSFSATLAAGPHTLDIKLANDAWYTLLNGYGFALSGTLSTTGNSLISESPSCTAYNCSTNPSVPAITGPTSVCEGATITLNDGIGGGTWSSSATPIATVASGPGLGNGIVTGVSAGSATITYTTSCGSVTYAITVVAAPAISGTASVCAGYTTTLTGTPSTGTWSGGGSAGTISDMGFGIGVVTGVSSGTDIFTYTSASGCMAFVTVTVNDVPSISGGRSTLCIGDMVGFSSSATGGSWSSSNTTVASVGSSSGIATGIGVGTAIISYVNPCGVGTYTVTVITAPSISGFPSLCLGGSTTLTGAPAIPGMWSGSTLVATVTTTGPGIGMVNGVGIGTALLTYALSPTCYATVTVSVDAAPVIIGPATVCQGSSITLSSGAAIYGSWTSSNTTKATVGTLTGIVTGVNPGAVTISYSNVCGTATHTMSVLPAPVVTSHITNVCVGNIITVTATPGPGGAWSGGTSVASVSNLGPGVGKVTGITPGTVVLTYTSASGCTTTVTITVDAIPSVSGPTSVCEGGTITLSDGGAIYGSWSSDDGTIASVDAVTGVVTGVAGGVVNINYTNFCGNSSYSITVEPTPAISGGPTVCIGGTVTLSASPSGGTWSSDNTTIATIDNSSGVVTGAGVGSTTITYTSLAGCIATATITAEECAHACTDSTKLDITSTTDDDGNCIYTATATIYTANLIVGYKWSGVGTAEIHHTHASTDTYTFTVTPGGTAVVSVVAYLVDTSFTDTISGPCCQATLTQTVTCGGGGGDMPRKIDHSGNLSGKTLNNISIFPNPTNNAVTISSANENITSIQVIDVNGKKLGDYYYENTKTTSISLDQLPPGSYLFRVNNSTSKVVTKIK